MNKRQKIIQGILGMAALFGCIIGPMSWFDSYNTQSTFNEFKENGIQRKVVVQNLNSTRVYRVVISTVDIAYTNEKTNEVEFKEDIEVHGLYQNKLKPGQEVEALFLKDQVILKDDYNWSNLPPFEKPYWGMIVTLLSYGYIGRLIVKNRKQNKKANNVSKSD